MWACFLFNSTLIEYMRNLDIIKSQNKSAVYLCNKIE